MGAVDRRYGGSLPDANVTEVNPCVAPETIDAMKQIFVHYAMQVRRMFAHWSPMAFTRSWTS